MCCPDKDYGQYIVEWCAGWVDVYMVVSYKQLNPDHKTYQWTSDFVTYSWNAPVWWTPWKCAELQTDYELTCVVENGNLYILKFDDNIWSYVVYDFSGTDVTWTVTPTQCEDSELTATSDVVCDNGTTTLYRHVVFNNWVPTWSIYFTDVQTWAIVVPAWTVTAWICPVTTTAPAGDNLSFASINVATSLTLPWFDISEIEVYAENPASTYEIEIWTSTWGTITHLVPATDVSRYDLELPVSDWYIVSVDITPTSVINNVIVNFYWHI